MSISQVNPLHSPESRAKACRTRLIHKERKQASQTHLDGGAKTYLDTLPGIDVVLLFPTGRKCYFGSLELAVDAWYKRYANTFGARVTQGDLKSPLVDAKVQEGFLTVTQEDSVEPMFTMGPLGLRLQ